MLSLGIDCALAAFTASRRRGFMSGSGAPIFAATVISRASLENIFDLAASWRPLRCMMFLNCEWPAIAPLLSRLVVSSDFRGCRAYSENDKPRPEGPFAPAREIVTASCRSGGHSAPDELGDPHDRRPPRP